jgi:peptide-methionine (R)-S-oxide reductase
VPESFIRFVSKSLLRTYILMNQPPAGRQDYAMHTSLSRRTILGGATALIGSMVALGTSACAQSRPERFPFMLTDAQWRQRLTSMQYYVLRQEGTERPFSSALDRERRAGTFRCAGCALPLFASSTKFDSGTGWPSFYAPLPRAVGTSTDYAIGFPRTEVHCARCGGHLGHVFDDGPQPTGKRYCMNGAALAFVARGQS